MALLAQILAFIERASIGHYIPYGENVDARARTMARRLRAGGLHAEIARVQLRRQSDLLDCEACLTEGGRELVRLLIESDPEPLRNTLEGEPVSKLFGAMLTEARKNGCDQLEVDFSGREPIMLGATTLPLPANLFPPLKGATLRAEILGPTFLRTLGRHPQLTFFQVHWPRPDLAIIILAESANQDSS